MITNLTKLHNIAQILLKMWIWTSTIAILIHSPNYLHVRIISRNECIFFMWFQIIVENYAIIVLKFLTNWRNLWRVVCSRPLSIKNMYITHSYEHGLLFLAYLQHKNLPSAFSSAKILMLFWVPLMHTDVC